MALDSSQDSDTTLCFGEVTPTASDVQEATDVPEAADVPHAFLHVPIDSEHERDALPSGDDMELPSEVEDEPAPSVPSYLDGTIRDDVLELFSPPRVVPRCKEQGLRAVMSIDLVTGFDLLTLDGRQRAMHEVTKRRPTVIISSPPCTCFSAVRNCRVIPRDGEGSKQEEEEEEEEEQEKGGRRCPEAEGGRG